MVIWEDGNLIKDAYVVINGVEYPVFMPEYSGKTNITAERLNTMQREIILYVTIPSGTTIQNGTTIEWEKGYNYRVGYNDLKVYWNGVLLKKATDSEDGHYTEGGDGYDDGDLCGFITMHRTAEDGNYVLTEDVLVTIVIKDGNFGDDSAE